MCFPKLLHLTIKEGGRSIDLLPTEQCSLNLSFQANLEETFNKIAMPDFTEVNQWKTHSKAVLTSRTYTLY